ncbi:MAG TPA: 50S ribosomal protein L21 [Clostridia bacterium]|jgi:large subunit ribosomal protein L21|nr:50S ribosomal protein L21 [Clostridia bacterium]
MYAILETGGKQYKVQPGDVIVVEKLDAEVGETVNLDKVMMIENEGQYQVGQPLIDNAKVVAKVMAHGKGKKVIVFKYKPKKNYRRKQGHRQPYTRLLIESIEA